MNSQNKSTKSNKTSNNNNNKNKLYKRKANNSRRRRNKIRKSQLNKVINMKGVVGQTQSVKLTKREMWFSDTFTQGTSLVTIKKRFDCTNGPSWFKQMCLQYEKYKIHGVNIYLRFGGSAMTKGLYVLTYNSNFSAISGTKTFEQLCCQKGSKIMSAAKQYGSIHINGSSLTGYSTNLPTEGTDESYCFNVIVAGTPAETVDFTVEVEYIVTFYNPTIAN